MIILRMLILNIICQYSAFFFLISDFFIYQTCNKNAWNVMNCYFLFTFPVLFTIFLIYTQTRRYRYLSLLFTNLSNMFWTMLGIFISSSFRIEQYLWLRFFVYGFSGYFCYCKLNKLL